MRTRDDSTEAQIQIIHTQGTPVLTILKNFYTTLVVNIISWNKAYAVFPQPSFLYHKTYLLIGVTDYFGKLLSKYGKRGWTVQGHLWPEDEESHKSMLEPRRLGDKWTWIIPLDQTGVSRPSTPDSVLEYSTFDLCKQEYNQPHPGYYSVEVMGFRSLVLGYNYVSLVDYADPWGFWTTFAGPRLERLSMIELCKIPSELRPPVVQARLDLVRSRMSDPDQDNQTKLYNLESAIGTDIELSYYDHEIPSWYAEWEKLRSSRVETAGSD